MKRAGWRWQVVRVTLVGATVFAGAYRLDALGAEQQQEQPYPTAKTPLFETDVLPLFKANCLRCHGEKARKAELDLRT